MKLTYEIVNYIFSNFGITEHKKFSIKSKSFILKEKINFDSEENCQNNVWGISILINPDSEMKILLADCSQFEDKEYALLISIKNSPTYGCYLSSDQDGTSILIFQEFWNQTTIYQQAILLAALEESKDLSYKFDKVTNYKKDYDQLISLIEYQYKYYENN